MSDYDRGLAVRREVLGDSYVDQAAARTSDLTRDFQTLVTEFAWGKIWTRPGLDRRSRSMITLTAEESAAGPSPAARASCVRYASTSSSSREEK